MDEATVQAIREIAEALRADLSGSIDALSKRCDALAEDVKANKKSDDAGERDRGADGTMAVRVAADAVDPAAFAALASSVADMRRKQTRPMSDLNAYADVQAKADSVMRALGSAAEPPMAGEDLVAYKIRTARKMQQHSPRWKGVD